MSIEAVVVFCDTIKQKKQRVIKNRIKAMEESGMVVKPPSFVVEYEYLCSLNDGKYNEVLELMLISLRKLRGADTLILMCDKSNGLSIAVMAYTEILCRKNCWSHFTCFY